MARAEKLAERLCHCVILLCQGKTLSVAYSLNYSGFHPARPAVTLPAWAASWSPPHPDAGDSQHHFDAPSSIAENSFPVVITCPPHPICSFGDIPHGLLFMEKTS
jgi:hypothetical protein